MHYNLWIVSIALVESFLLKTSSSTPKLPVHVSNKPSYESYIVVLQALITSHLRFINLFGSCLGQSLFLERSTLARLALWTLDSVEGRLCLRAGIQYVILRLKDDAAYCRLFC
ncbi:hypothetical protein IWW34DRAFT_734237 [Fusarium oxysporum f. sp. albedinis]|nr:hypothetical protein IWW34DRAFT_734237 [Fusarium oxysporum f. sp. albedinis]